MGLYLAAPRGEVAERAGGKQSHIARRVGLRSEEHTSELQSPCNLVCRLLLEKKKKKKHHRLTVASLPNLGRIKKSMIQTPTAPAIRAKQMCSFAIFAECHCSAYLTQPMRQPA